MALPPDNIIIKRSKVISHTSDFNADDNDMDEFKQKSLHKRQNTKKIFYHNYLIGKHR